MATAFYLLADGADQVRAELQRRMAKRGSSKRVAHELGVSRQALCNIRDGRRAPSEKVAAALGFRRVLRFERVE